VLDQAEFDQRLIKEQARCARLPGLREFACIRVGFSEVEPQIVPESIKRLTDYLRVELRLFDEIGVSGQSITLLLPETGRDGAAIVVDRLSVLADDLGQPLDVTVFVYPGDDPVARVGIDLPGNSEHAGSGPWNGHSNGKPHRHSETNGTANGFPQFDVITPNGFHEKKNGKDTDGGISLLERVRVKDSVRTYLAAPEKSRTVVQSPASTACDVLISYTTPVWKRTMDILGSSLGLVLVSPILLLAAAAIRIDSSGPILFLQPREGKDGKIFKMLKFRTMENGAEELQESLRGANEQDGPAFKVTQDPRVTRVGMYLRKSCIDELPQLVNILLGQMSLVGPRPLPVGESLNSCIWHRQRLSVLPGLTCLWQISGQRNMKFDRWMRLDLEYIRKRSFWFDVKLICKTLLLAVRHRGNS